MAERRARVLAARAFAPAHLTGLFAPDLRARDPRGRGSVGAGIVLDRGVWAEARWEPAARRRQVRIVSVPAGPRPISREVAQRLFAGRPGRLTVRLRHELPIGQGFGMSAAGALATGLAVAGVLGRSRREAVETAHLADLFGGGGLGGVAAILGGGLERRRRAGIPPWGRVDRRAFSRPVYMAVLGRPLPSPRLLRDPRFLARVRRAHTRAEELLRRDGSARGFGRAAELFGEEVGLAPRRVAQALKALRVSGAYAAQAMFGRTVYAYTVARGPEIALRRRFRTLGLTPLRCHAAVKGGRLVGRRPS